VSFGTVAPTNPVRGHFWWDGTTLWMFDGAAWVDTSTGGGTPPSTTAPANPQPGQQWFNGSTLFVWDGNAWVPVSQTKTSVQATAPPAPNPGDMWWDGTQFRIWDGSAWRMVGPGATVGPVPTVTHVFQITNPTASVVPTTAPLGIWAPTSTPTIDSLAAWNSTTHQYLPKTAGVYFFTTRTPTTGTYSSHTLLKNDGGSWVLNSNIYITVASVASATAQNQWLGSSGMVVMNGSTDFVRLWAADSTGSLYAAGVLPFIDAYLLP
jgi:hypothetical protein